MNLISIKASLLAMAFLLLPAIARGHGDPALISVISQTIGGEKLLIQGNVDNPQGYASEVLAETLGDAVLTSITGDRLFTDYPGFDLTEVTPNAQLWIEPLRRPYATSTGVQDRLLWYWSPSEQQVAIAPEEVELQLFPARGFDAIQFPQFGMSPGAVQFMEPLPSDIGQHQHTLYHLLQNGSAAPAGAYGYFARLTSPAYEPSEPFLVMLNHGLDAATLLAATEDINLAALSLPGDFNNDGTVNLADYTVWRDNLGAADDLAINSAGDGAPGIDAGDYAVWKTQFGATATQSTAILTPIPEPPTATVLVMLLTLALVRRVQHPTLPASI